MKLLLCSSLGRNFSSKVMVNAHNIQTCFFIDKIDRSVGRYLNFAHSLAYVSYTKRFITPFPVQSDLIFRFLVKGKQRGGGSKGGRTNLRGKYVTEIVNRIAVN